MRENHEATISANGMTILAISTASAVCMTELVKAARSFVLGTQDQVMSDKEKYFTNISVGILAASITSVMTTVVMNYVSEEQTSIEEVLKIGGLAGKFSAVVTSSKDMVLPSARGRN